MSSSSDTSPEGLHTSLREFELCDWRRRIAELYALVRAAEPLAGWQQWRTERDRLFRHHSQSPIEPQARAEFVGLPYFPYDPSYRFLVDVGEPQNRATITMEVGSDGEVRLYPFACTRGLAPRLGNELTLYWIGGYGGGVFLPCRDATSGHETFGGGRYLLDTIKGADLGQAPDGRLILDFNFAYNPSCAYADRWICPLAPVENRLANPVRAGERLRG
jgi:uncharacterized protein (DUF1684 family)